MSQPKKNKNKYIDTTPEITEKTAVVSFGRFNPPTLGHKKLVDKVNSIAESMGADSGIYLSHSHDKNSNPLKYSDKLGMCQIAFGDVIKESDIRNILQVAEEYSDTHENLVVVVGSDRLLEFKNLLEKYNGVEYDFNRIDVVSAGDRDSDTTSDVSASRARQHARTENFVEFAKLLPENLQIYSEAIMESIKSSEPILFEAPLNIQQRRARGLQMRKLKNKMKIARKRNKKKMASSEKLKQRARKKAKEILRDRLSKKPYGEMKPAEKIALDTRLQRLPKTMIDKIAKRQLPLVKKAERERLKQELSGGNSKQKTEETITEASKADTRIVKRYHQALDKNGSVKFDGRFRYFKPNAENSRLTLESMVEEYVDFATDINERFEQQFVKMDTLLKLAHKHVQAGEDIQDVAWNLSRTKDVNISAKKIQSEYNKKYKTSRTVGDGSKLKKKYGFRSENTASDREEGSSSLVKILKNDTPGYENLDEGACPILTMEHIRAFEKFVDKLFKKFNIDFDFTRHFGERMSDSRNDPCIKMTELASMITKIYKRYQNGKGSLSNYTDSEAVIKDLQTDLNMPIAVEYDRSKDELVVIAKTIMRKKNFRTTSPEVRI